MVLAEIEAKTGKRIAELFDLISGVSTGGILACLTTSNKLNTQDITSFYEQYGPVIFNRSLIGKVGIGFGLFGPKYSNDNLKAALDELLSGARLSECSTNILVTAYDIERRQPFFFKSHKAVADSSRDFPLADVALATASAPTYFPPAKISHDGDYLALIDGGVFTTNPAMCAYVEAKTLWPSESILLVSLGTGELTRRLSYDKAKGWGLAAWAQKILDIMFDSTSDTVDYQCQQILNTRYRRIQCVLDRASDDMDDASPENLKLLKIQAEEMIKNNRSAIDALCEEIKGGLK